MTANPGHTRSARPEEFDEIHTLLEAAFGRPDEAVLVRQLRTDGDMWMELVKDWDGRIAAYAALSWMQEPAGWVCLAPVAVWPPFQRGACAPTPDARGQFSFGTRLVREIATVIAADDKPPPFPLEVVVMGDPGFYSRAGFSPERAQGLRSPYPIEHTLLAGTGPARPVATLVYPAAFESM